MSEKTSDANRIETEKINQFLEGVENPFSLIEVLHKVQDHYGYIPKEAFNIIGDRLNIPYAQIYGVVTFYSRFSLVPKGKYAVSVCNGTACYVKGAENIMNTFADKLGIKVGETTEDLNFSVTETRCLGACAEAPIVAVNDHLYEKVNVEDIEKIISDALEGKIDE